MLSPGALRLGLPSKGRLMEQAVELFAAAGVGVERSAEGREYAGRVTGVADVALVMLSAGDIPRALAEGAIHLGVTGEDLLAEKIDDPARVRVLRRLGFGHADLLAAVPAAWADVETMHDLDEAAADFRARHGRPLRVATKYHRLARRFFAQAGVADYRLVDSQGATEAAPKNGAAEAIVDIASTGETLRANHLRPLSDGLILASQAALALSETAPRDRRAARALAGLAERLDFSAA